MTTVNEAGRGRKQCSACKNYVGVRTGKCECGHEFAGSAKASPAVTVAGSAVVAASKPAVVEERVVRPNIHSAELIAPAGPCPIALASAEPEVVKAWVADIQSYYARKGYTIGMTGIRYLVSKCFAPSSDEYKAAVAVIPKG